MIDLHCHILPGLDDGPGTIEESVAMCRIAAGDGITTIVATPHFSPGRYQASSAEVLRGIAALEQAVAAAGITIRIVPGAEVSVIPELAAFLGGEPHLTINASRRYFLAEIPSQAVLPRWDSFLLSLLPAGRTPILTHPERNPWFRNNPEALFGFVVRGGMVQITAAGLTGLWGEQVREFCCLLLRHNLVHCIASDAHDAGPRRPELADAVRAASAIIGAEPARSLVTTIPRAIIDGRDISHPGPLPLAAVSRKKSWIERLVS